VVTEHYTAVHYPQWLHHRIIRHSNHPGIGAEGSGLLDQDGMFIGVYRLKPKGRHKSGSFPIAELSRMSRHIQSQTYEILARFPHRSFTNSQYMVRPSDFLLRICIDQSPIRLIKPSPLPFRTSLIPSWPTQSLTINSRVCKTREAPINNTPRTFRR
jgi:hypothetical protein